MSTTHEPTTSPEEPRRSGGAAPLDPTQLDRDEGPPHQVGDGEANENHDAGATTPPISPKQQAANERNAQKSTGPRSDEGKARSSLNALRHGIYGRPNAIRRGELGENEKEVAEFIEALMDDLAPRDAQELVVARRIAEGELRLARADRFESVGLSAAGRLSGYDRKSGLGQEQEEDRDFLIHDLREASQLLGGAEASATHNDWFQTLAVIYTTKGVPPERREYPEEWVIGGEWWDAGIWKRFVLDKLVPRYWPSREAASAALEETAEGLWMKAQDLDGVAEERAVESALKVGGILDRASMLRTRAQRAVERDRATYAELRERHLGGGDEGGES
jgi:hypothetical protein